MQFLFTSILPRVKQPQILNKPKSPDPKFSPKSLIVSAMSLNHLHLLVLKLPLLLHKKKKKLFIFTGSTVGAKTLKLISSDKGVKINLTE